jgi:lipopolysaccharide/colanic/teichoic acid biosynthesis glycosyltransferase
MLAKRLLDVVGAGLGLAVTAPLLAVAAAGIKLADPGGPVLYKAQRAGKGGRPFTMFKLRTMRHTARGADDGGARITAARDRRVFRFGQLLRRAKIDELPQLFNVLRGDMSLVGPRPEDPEIVQRHYRAHHYETLAVRPGLASPGSLYQFVQGEALLGRDPETGYVTKVLNTKLALDLVYVRNASLRRDLAIIGRTVWMIGSVIAGKRRFRQLPEMREARRILAQERRRPSR